MANIKTSALVSDISGKVGGNIFSRTRYGLAVRAFTKPVNVNSTLQQVARAAMAALVDRWGSALTDEQRIAWALYGDSVSMQNVFGDSMNLTGQNMFIRSNTIRLQNGLDPIDDAPTIFDVPDHDPSLEVAFSEASQEISVTYDDSRSWAVETGGHMFIYMGTPQNPQRNFFNGPWRYAGKIDGSEPTPPTSPATIDCSFAASEGQRIWVACRIQRADGRLSQRFRASGFCGA